MGAERIPRLYGAGIGDPVTVLLLDNSASAREVISRYLQREGYSVLQASNESQLQKIIQENGADIAVVDYNLGASTPTGIEIMENIHKEYMIPFIVISGKSQVDGKSIAFEAAKYHARAFIEKGTSDFHSKLLAELHSVFAPRLDKSAEREYAFRTGEFVGEFQVVSPWRHGSYKEVYKGRRPGETDKMYAVKVMRSPEHLRGRRVFMAMVAASWDFSAKFLEEYKALARAPDNENLVSLESFGRINHPDTPSRSIFYIIEEFIDGLNLGEYLKKLKSGVLPLEEFYYIFARIARGIESLHKKNYAHRDIIAENILLGRKTDGRFRPVLTDFGNMRNIYSPRDTPIFFGTLQHLAPEQLKGKAGSILSDSWALGVTMYHALSGQKPFCSPKTDWSGLSLSEILEQETEVAHSILEAKIVPPSVLRSSRDSEKVPKNLDALISNLLSRSPVFRPKMNTLYKKLESLSSKHR